MVPSPHCTVLLTMILPFLLSRLTRSLSYAFDTCARRMVKGGFHLAGTLRQGGMARHASVIVPAALQVKDQGDSRRIAANAGRLIMSTVLGSSYSKSASTDALSPEPWQTPFRAWATTAMGRSSCTTWRCLPFGTRERDARRVTVTRHGTCDTGQEHGRRDTRRETRRST